MEQFFAVSAALTVLAAYAGLQFGYLDNKKPLFNWINFLGAMVLSIVAIRAR